MAEKNACTSPALPRCTRSFIRQQSLKAHPRSTQPPSPLQNPRLVLTHQFALFDFSDGSVITDALMLCRAELNLSNCYARPLIIKWGTKPTMTQAPGSSSRLRVTLYKL